MVKKNDSILDLLALFPWWVSVALSGSSYLILEYFIPTIEFQQKGPEDMTYMLFKGLANAALKVDQHFLKCFSRLLDEGYLRNGRVPLLSSQIYFYKFWSFHFDG